MDSSAALARLAEAERRLEELTARQQELETTVHMLELRRLMLIDGLARLRASLDIDAGDATRIPDWSGSSLLSRFPVIP
jgi:cell division protein FtsB